MKKMLGILIVLAFIGSICFAQEAAKTSPAPIKASSVTDVGNKICPVSGQKVDGQNFCEYNGKRYGMCCPMCEAAFKADPKKYSAIADKEVAGK
ncbi:MAG: YHS domain-containing protein [Candidatus Omnitrophica bacterium]|nr:YHS domain-containing protein [Candidatus Omnitrophota bacterium]